MKVLHVPYKGAGPALNDLLGGHIRVLISAVPNAHSHIAAGPSVHSQSPEESAPRSFPK